MKFLIMLIALFAMGSVQAQGTVNLAQMTCNNDGGSTVGACGTIQKIKDTAFDYANCELGCTADDGIPCVATNGTKYTVVVNVYDAEVCHTTQYLWSRTVELAPGWPSNNLPALWYNDTTLTQFGTIQTFPCGIGGGGRHSN